MRLIAVVLLFSLAVVPATGADAVAKRHQDWLKGPASLLITRAEREAFAVLKTEEERDVFVDRFWDVRNPARGTGGNEFKEEFFRRVAYVDAFYGRDAGSDGWRTDRGRAYILFGKPKSTANFLQYQELYPVELWFYANPGLTELPAFFYVLFFDRDGVGGYRFYHPYVDGPDKLMRNGPTKQAAYQYLRRISPELATATLTLIPGEPVDTETYSGSMSSATILRAIQGYNEMPSYVSLITARITQQERITSRVDYDVARTNLLTAVVWENGEPWLHYHVEVSDPLHTKASGGQFHYEVKGRLLSGGQLVLERSDSPRFPASPAADRRPFVFEDRIPVTEGSYQLAVAIENKATGKLYEASKKVEVTARLGQPLVSNIVVVSRFEPDGRTRPFQFGGVKFFPDATGHTWAVKGLRFFYQVVLTEPRPAELPVEYVIGSVTSKFRKTFEDKLDLKSADASGSLITGKTLALDDVAPGNYQLAVRVKDPATGRIMAQSASFQVLEGATDVQPIVVSQARPLTPQWLAASHYERALCWLSQGRSQEAITALEASWDLSKNQTVRGLLDHLKEQGRLKQQAIAR